MGRAEEHEEWFEQSQSSGGPKVPRWKNRIREEKYLSRIGRQSWPDMRRGRRSRVLLRHTTVRRRRSVMLSVAAALEIPRVTRPRRWVATRPQRGRSRTSPKRNRPQPPRENLA